VPQLVDLLSVLPHDDFTKMMGLLPEDQAYRVRAIISEREATAGDLKATDYVAATRESTVGQVLDRIRNGKYERHSISYVYILGENKLLVGVVDLRELVLAPDTATLGEIMTSPVVSAQRDDLREDLEEMFAKYHYRAIPVVDEHDCMLGVVYYKDIMKGLVTRAKT